MEATMAAPKVGARELLANRNYRSLWLAQVVSDFGDSLTSLALLILVNAWTGSTAALATMAIALAVPQVVFGLLAGVYVDRLDRKRIMIFSDVVRGALVLLFILAAAMHEVWLLYVIGFVQASIGTLFNPARSALLPDLVPQEGLLAANSLSQTSRIIAGVAGTAAAGLLIGLFSTAWPAFALDAVTFFVSALLVSRIVVRAHAAAQGEKATPRVILTQLADGLRAIAGSRLLLGTLLAVGVTMLGLGAVNVLIVPLLINDLQVPETWFGAVQLAQTLAMILSGGLVLVLAGRFKPAQIVGVCLLVLGLLTGLIAFAGSIWLLMLILFAVGWAVTPLQASVSTIMQTSVDRSLLGRAGAAMSTVIGTTNLISMAFAGVLGEVVGVRNVFLVAGVVVLLAALGSTWIYRSAPAHAAPEAV